MATATRKTSLESRSARAKLRRGKRYSVRISQGTALVYRRAKGREAAGTWYVRIARGGNKYAYKSIGEADDFRDANGASILDYFQAQGRAREAADTYDRERSTYTVKRALSDYFANYPGREASVPRIRASVEPHILPALGDRPVNALTTGEIEAWREKLIKAPARIRGESCVREIPKDSEERAEYTRRRKATCNRVVGVLRAALNYAWRTREDIPSNKAWAKVRPYRAVSRGRVDFLTQSEARRLINEAPPDLGRLIKGALLTGARPGEIRGMRVEDFDHANKRVFIRKPKGAQKRSVPLNKEGVKFFDQITAGCDGKEFLFTRDDSKAWSKDAPRRPLSEACRAAKVRDINLYALRHTFATLLLAENVSMHYLAKVMGTSVKMIEDHYGHIVEEYQRETINKLPAFGGKAGKVARIA